MWEGSVERSCEPMNKNRIEGAAEQGERAKNREALVIKARWRRSGGRGASYLEAPVPIVSSAVTANRRKQIHSFFCEFLFKFLAHGLTHFATRKSALKFL